MSPASFKRCALFLFLLLTGGIASAQARITQDEAKRIVHYALKAESMDGPTVDVSPVKNDYAPDFYSFEATWPNPDGSPMLGGYAVNPWTGDVWQFLYFRRLNIT